MSDRVIAWIFGPSNVGKRYFMHQMRADPDHWAHQITGTASPKVALASRKAPPSRRLVEIRQEMGDDGDVLIHGQIKDVELVPVIGGRVFIARSVHHAQRQFAATGPHLPGRYERELTLLVTRLAWVDPTFLDI